uniref:Uncharacterized protein n=1 Tax=Lates calcarifer TaxID=8187 RepID=A0A4W6DQJ9_LATCA
MKLAMTFLVLTLVVLMAEPGECGLWGRLKAVWRGAKAAWKGKSQVNTHSDAAFQQDAEAYNR